MTFDPWKKFFEGTEEIGIRHRLMPGFAACCYEQWRDLPNGASVVIIPKDDFFALLEELRGHPYIATRGFLIADLPPRPEPIRPMSEAKRSLIAELLRKARRLARERP